MIYILIRDDREHDEGDERNLAGYTSRDYATAVCDRLNAVIKEYDAYTTALAKRGAEDVAAEWRAAAEKVIQDLDAIFPGAGDGYSNHKVKFRVQPLPVID